jgi:hypothetical protein
MGAAACKGRATRKTRAAARCSAVEMGAAAREVGPAPAGDVSTTTATAREVSATTTSATVGFTGPSRQRRPDGYRQSGQHSEGPGENSSMFHRHGIHSVAGPTASPRGISTL